jgi:CheY-like chemotaxis protein
MRTLILEDSVDRFQSLLPFLTGLQNPLKKAPEPFLHWDRDSKSAIERIKQNQYDVIFLDHDLDHLSFDYAGTGMDVVDFLVENHPDHTPWMVVVHSMNVVRAPEMIKRLIGGGIDAHGMCNFPSRDDLKQYLYDKMVVNAVIEDRMKIFLESKWRD